MKRPIRVEFPAQMALAKQIAADLFKDGSSMPVVRLIAVHQEEPLHLGGGWSQEAMTNRIYRHLIGELS